MEQEGVVWLSRGGGGGWKRVCSELTEVKTETTENSFQELGCDEERDGVGSWMLREVGFQTRQHTGHSGVLMGNSPERLQPQGRKSMLAREAGKDCTCRR